MVRLELTNPPKVWGDIDFQIRVEVHDSEAPPGRPQVEISTRYLDWRPGQRRLNDDEMRKPGFYGNVMALRCDEYDDGYDDDPGMVPGIDELINGRAAPSAGAAQTHKFCIMCGAKLPGFARFCSACGEPQEFA